MGRGSAATATMPPAAAAAIESIPLPDRDLCFAPSALTSGAADDVATFIADLRQRAPLSLIRDDLRALMDTVHAELVACVQRDFNAFVALGPSIAAADAAADAATAPLEALRSELAALLQDLDGDIATLAATLEERRQVADRIAALRVLLRANDLLHKCERLLKDYAGLDKASEDAFRLVERIAGECAQLSFTLSRAGNGSFVKSIAVRVSVVRRTVRTSLEGWLRRALFPQTVLAGSPYDCELLRRVLDSFVVAGIGSDAEEFFRREFVAPFTSERIRMTPLLAIAEREKKEKMGMVGEGTGAVGTAPGAGRSGMARSGAGAGSGVTVTAADALEVAERIVIDFIGEKLTPIVSLCESEERLRTRLDFVGNALWPQVAQAIATHMQSAFSPGTPDVFHQSVLSGTRLYEAVENVLVSEGQVAAMRKSVATVEFWRHWNLPVYFQLRFQEITSKFDAFLQLGPEAVDSAASKSPSGNRLPRSDMYLVQATVGLVDALRECWSERVYLKSLAHRFLRLSLQVLARYVTWVRTGLAGEWPSATSCPAGVARVYADVVVVQTRVPAEFASLLRMRDTGLTPALLDDVENAFSGSVDAFSELLEDLSRSMSDSLARSCSENLQPLRGILATYRMSSKPAPTSHSPFVPKVLRPLKTFLNEQRGCLSDEARKKVAGVVAESTTAKYYDMATDLLNSNKKSEETLRRLNIGRGGGAAGRGTQNGSMTDKVSMQLYLDVAKFKDDIEALGVSLKGVPSMARLWECVRRDESSDESGAQEPAKPADVGSLVSQELTPREQAPVATPAAPLEMSQESEGGGEVSQGLGKDENDFK
jgi:conserved oligomeric Golgi complex subunit 2